MTRHGGRILVDQLELHGAELAFGVPGESYLAVLDALHDSPIRFVSARHEAGAANMADAYGKLTNRPGICLVTRGPGATQASVGIHTAYQDATPLILLVGQIPVDHRGREAFQELDLSRTFGGMAKWVAELDSPERIPELVARAFAVATSGRPGPVVLGMPEDVLAATAVVADAAGPYIPAQAAPDDAELARLYEILGGAQRPLVLVGGQPWTTDAAVALTAWCEASALPVASAFRCQDYADNASPSYAGHLGIGPDPNLARRLSDCDVLIAIGTRAGDTETGGFEALPLPDPGTALVHVLPDPDELGRVYRPALPIVASGPRFVAALEAVDGARWADWTTAARADYVANLEATRELPGDVDLFAVMRHLRETLPEQTMITNGAGNFSVWAHRFYAFRRYRTQLAPTSGAMGYGLPAAITARLLKPDVPIICFAGDGDFVMSLPELATAVQHRTPFVVLVFDNGMFGTIRMHQERHYPGRVSGTELENPDFVALAEAFGCHGERVTRTEEFPAAFERSLAASVPAVVHLVVDPEAITPRATLGEIRENAVRRGA